MCNNLRASDEHASPSLLLCSDLQQLVADASADAQVSAKGPPSTEPVWHKHLVVLPGRAMLQVARPSLLVPKAHFSSSLQQHPYLQPAQLQDGRMLGARTQHTSVPDLICKNHQGQLQL
jgi:hypothetical protein